MKVICIDDNWPYKDGTEPEFGEICTATQCNVYGDCYNISEYPFNSKGKPQVFYKRYFAPLSDIDETETEVYKNLQTQTV